MPKKLTAYSLLLTVYLLLSSTLTFAQKTISGKVTGNNNEPVSGATVSVKGTNVATQTNAEGTFTLNSPTDKSILVISNVGFENAEVTPSGAGPLNVSLKPTNATLTEVVVTGYTSQTKKDITSSVAVVNVKELVANPGSNIQSLLQGRAAGVTVGTSGVPGTGANVHIHGYSTFGNNAPLYIVDGARVGAITELNPDGLKE